MLKISENLRSKGERPRLLHDQIWAKMQFWKPTGAVLSISENLGVKNVKVYHMSEYGQNLKKKSCGHNTAKYGTEYFFWKL